MEASEGEITLTLDGLKDKHHTAGMTGLWRPIGMVISWHPPDIKRDKLVFAIKISSPTMHTRSSVLIVSITALTGIMQA